MNQGNCTHTDEERCIVGTWVLDEVCKAIEMRYNLMKVLEFRQYELTCFDRGTNSGGIFAEYVNMFLKLNRNRLATHPGFNVRLTRTSTSRTTGAQKEFL